MAGDTCDVCQRGGVVGVASSALGPISLAYCRECLNNRADAEWLFAYTLECTEGNVADWVKTLSTWRDGAYVSWSDWVAQGGEARGAETGTGSVHEHPVGNADAPPPPSHPGTDPHD